MSMKKRQGSRQEEMFVQASALPDSPGHPFYAQLNELLAAHDFDLFVEERCAPCYAQTLGRPSIPPGVYFRMLMIGYFEGYSSERGIAWRVADFAGPAPVSGVRVDRDHAGSLEPVAHSSAPVAGGAPRGLQLGAEGAGQTRPAQR